MGMNMSSALLEPKLFKLGGGLQMGRTEFHIIGCL